MSIPPIPPTLESMGDRSFSFFPPVLNVEHNEWKFSKATWSEILVVNTKTNMEIWVPRRLLGEVSRVDEPVMIVGLKRELEYRAGALVPHERRVIEMPKAVNDSMRPLESEPAPPGPVFVSGMRTMNEGAESRIGKMILFALGGSLLITFLIVGYFRSKNDVKNVAFVGIEQQALNLTAQDDYHTVVRRLGQPREDRWRSEQGEIQYRVLHYPDRGLNIILMGHDRDLARYIGSFDESWKPVHFVELPNKQNTRAMLTRLERF